MKIGLSLSKCLPDIIYGTVDYNDVMLIITGTCVEEWDDKNCDLMWGEYRYIRSVWRQYPEKDKLMFVAMIKRLANDGKLHQPRLFDARPPQMHYCWLDTMITSADMQHNPTAEKLWNQYKLIQQLGGKSTPSV